MSSFLILTCEHGGIKIPPEVKSKINIPPRVLETHQGYDIGALATAHTLAKMLKAPLVANEITRLVIDCNRSLRHPDLFSAYSRKLATQEKEQLIQNYYSPYRNKATTIITDRKNSGQFVFHLSIHSFTPVLKGKERKTDIGILYDPGRAIEKNTAKQMQITFAESGLAIRKNYPYKGIADGFTTFLRKQFTEDEYAGIEIEINQNLLRKRSALAEKLGQSILALSLNAT